MVIRNREDTYETTQKESQSVEIGDIPETCDVKDALICKLEELDNKIYQLEKSNKLMEQEIDSPETDPEDALEYKEFIKENDDVILNSKD